jgi:hypothetical protein
MAHYRIYLLGPDGHIVAAAQLVDLANDSEALLFAQQVAAGFSGAEVWNGAQMVCRVPPLPLEVPSTPASRWPRWWTTQK